MLHRSSIPDQEDRGRTEGERERAGLLAQGAFIVIANTLEFAVSRGEVVRRGGCALCPSTLNSSPHPAK